MNMNMNFNNDEVVNLFVPGRLCLFGEHSDWAGTNRVFNSKIVPGKAIVTGVEQGIYAVAKKSERFIVKSDIQEFKGSSFSCEMNISKLRETAQKGSFFSYVSGVASYICEWYHTGGVEITITSMNLPIKSGLSSSAAICVLVAKAFNELYALHLNTLGIMNIAYWGEQRTPSRCGRLDQACAFGTVPVEMTFDGNEINAEKINLGGDFFFVFADLNSHKDTIKILADLSKAYPFPHNEMEEAIHSALGNENVEIIKKAKILLETGNAKELGILMKEAQCLFDTKIAPLCKEELTAPILHETLNDKEIIELTYGGKGVGSQGDGTVQFLAKDSDCQKKLILYLNKEKNMNAYALTLRKKTGIRKAIIPVAGFGTRMYPVTRGIKKEFCPVVDKDGLAKPGILILLEELDSIGIEEICLIMKHEEVKYYKDFFFTSLSEEHFKKLPDNMKKYEASINRISKKLTFAFQDEAHGFGHAVYQAKDFAGNDPVILLLGDTIYESKTDIPCTKQLIDNYNNSDLPMIGLLNIKLNNVNTYGVFSGTWEDSKENKMKIEKVYEKPSVEYAKKSLCTKKFDNTDNYYGAFGCYIITKDVFNRLEFAINNNIVNSKNEIELTEALEYVQKEKGMFGFVPEGISYDLGNPEAYRKAVSSFGLKNN